MGHPSQHPISILVPMLSYSHRPESPISPIMTWSLRPHTSLPYISDHFLIGSLFCVSLHNHVLKYPHEHFFLTASVLISYIAYIPLQLLFAQNSYKPLLLFNLTYTCENYLIQVVDGPWFIVIYDFGVFHKNWHEVNHISPFLLVHHIKLDNRSYMVLFHCLSTHNPALDRQPVEEASVRVCTTSSSLVCNMYLFLGMTHALEK